MKAIEGSVGGPGRGILIDATIPGSQKRPELVHAAGRRVEFVQTPACWSKTSRMSAGVRQARDFRGRLFQATATAARSSSVCLLRSVPFGKH